MSELQKIYNSYAKPLYRFLLKLSGSESMAEELLQETFYQAIIHIGSFEGRSSVYTWLCRIGKNAWLKECHRSSRISNVPLEEINAEAHGPAPEESLLRREELMRIRQAIANLEEPYKEVFILHVFGGVKLKQIAEEAGKSESWARVTYHRARNQIVKEVIK